MKKFILGLTVLFLSNALFANSSVQAVSSAKSVTNALANVYFIQNSSKATLEKNSTTANQYTLTLNDVGSHTVYFTDRPNRIVGQISHQDYLKSWNSGKNSMKNDAPNALLTGIVKNGHQPYNMIFMLSKPSYNANKTILTYQATPLLAKNLAFFPSNTKIELQNVTLFVDSGSCNTCIAH